MINQRKIMCIEKESVRHDVSIDFPWSLPSCSFFRLCKKNRALTEQFPVYQPMIIRHKRMSLQMLLLLQTSVYEFYEF